MAQLIHILAAGVQTDSGSIADSGTVTSYLSGTTTLQTIYQDSDLTNPHPNPATLSSGGQLIAYTDKDLKLVLSESDGTVIRTINKIQYSRGNTTSGEIGADEVKAVNINSDVAGDGLGQASGGALQVRVDDSTIEINSDILRVKDSGITRSKLASTASEASSASGDINQQVYNSHTLITNCSVSITTQGGPVFVALQSAHATEPAQSSDHHGVIGALTATGTDEQADLSLSFRRDATVIAVFTPMQKQVHDAADSDPTQTFSYWPASSFFHIDTPAAGTYTYAAYLMSWANANAIDVKDIKLIAVEL